MFQLSSGCVSVKGGQRLCSQTFCRDSSIAARLCCASSGQKMHTARVVYNIAIPVS